MPELVTIPVSFIELVLDYQRQDLKLWVERAHIIQTIFDALQPWNPHIDDLEPISTGKLSEQGFTLKLPLKRVSFFFGPASCRFTRDAADWDMVQESITMIDTAISAFIHFSGMVIAAQRVAVGLHLQPKTAPFMQILSPFLPPQLVSLEKNRSRRWRWSRNGANEESLSMAQPRSSTVFFSSSRGNLKARPPMKT
jgi:hypothetical protein